MIWMTLGRLSDFNWNELAWEMNSHSHFPCWNKDSIMVITVNMKMSIKTSITIVIVIVNNVTYIIIIIMDSAHISLISAGISLSCGKDRMDIRVVFQTQTRPLLRRQWHFCLRNSDHYTFCQWSLVGNWAP